jgi:predicted DNA-binding transcriptional regulator AlpA
MAPHCYTTAQVLARLQMSRSTFFSLKQRGQIPCLEEIRPRLGRLVRYRAEPIDRFVEGQWGQSRFFGSHRRVG